MSRISDIEGALLSLDAATDRPQHDSTRALSDLQRILATPTASPPLHPPTPVSRAVRRTRAGRRAGLAAAVVAAVTVGVLTLPSLSGGDPAFASWTPSPEAVPTAERAEAAADCRDAQSNDAGYAAQLSSAETVIAERRGVWTTVVLAGRNGFTALCITDESRPFYDRGMIGHIGAPADWTPVGARDLAATSLGDGVVDNNELSMAAGFAGSEITGIVYRSPSRGDVTATLAQGHFALWLPGSELGNASREGVELQVSYRDGTTSSQLLTM